MVSDSTMPVTFRPSDFDTNPLDSTQPERALNCIHQLTSILQAPDSSLHSMAMLSRVVANDFADMTGYCFRKLETSPWGDDERAGLASAKPEAERDES